MLPTSAMGTSFQGSSTPLPCTASDELAPGRLVHLELVGDGDLGLAVAVEVGRGAADDAGRLLPDVTIRFFQVGFSYQAQCDPPRATMSGFLSPLTSATSTW